MSENNKEEQYGDKNQYWKPHIMAWEQSGESQVEYCRQHGLNIKLFGYWKRKLVKKSGSVSFVPVSIKPSHAISLTPGSSLRIVTYNGLRIEVGDGFNPATLRMLLDTIVQRV